MTGSFFLVVSGFVGIFVIGELAHRIWQISSETTRKMVHILAGLLAAVLPWYLSYQEVITLGITSSVLLVVSQRLNLLPSIHAVNRKTIGEIAFPLGLLLAAFFFFKESPAAFQVGVLTLALSDSAASLVGQAIGRREYSIFGTRKTYEGSLAFLVVVLVLITVFASASQPLALSTLIRIFMAGVALTIIEAVAVRGWDNLILPVAAGTLGKWLALL